MLGIEPGLFERTASFLISGPSLQSPFKTILSCTYISCWDVGVEVRGQRIGVGFRVLTSHLRDAAKLSDLGAKCRYLLSEPGGRLRTQTLKKFPRSSVVNRLVELASEGEHGYERGTLPCQGLPPWLWRCGFRIPSGLSS